MSIGNYLLEFIKRRPFISALLVVSVIVILVVVIVVASKKSTESNETLKKSIAIEVNKVDYETLAEQKHKLKDNNINTLIVTLNDAYEFDENKPEVKFVREMKKDGYNVIIALNPVVTDYYLVWSQSSEKSEYKGKFDKYASYYIWKSGSNGENPNKWETPKNKSVWRYVDTRLKYVYCPGDLPTLNFTNPDVITEFNTVLEFWLNNTVDGFMLKDIPYIFFENDFANDTKYNHMEYGIWKQMIPEHKENITNILKEWRNIIKKKNDGSYNDGSVQFLYSEELQPVNLFKEDNIFDQPIVKYKIEASHSIAEDLYKHLNFTSATKNIMPLWDLTSTALDDSVMNIVKSLLPGKVILYDKYKEIDDFKVDKKLLDIQREKSIVDGEYFSQLSQDGKVFAYQRSTECCPSYIIAWNPNPDFVSVNLKEMFQEIPSEVTVKFASPEYDLNKKVPSNNFRMKNESAVVFIY